MTLPTLGGGNRVRIEQYVGALRRDGIEMDVSPFFDDAAYRILYRSGHVLEKTWAVLRGAARRLRDLIRARRYDLILVYRESAPVGPPLFERVLRGLGIPYVFDFDDAIFLAPIHPANRRWAWLRHPSRVVETTRHAAAVIVGNEYLASWARSHNAVVEIIPSSVDTDRFRPALVARADRPVVIGWVGSSTTAPYLELLDGPLAELARTHPELTVRVIGGTYRHPSMPVESLPYRLEQEPLDVAAFDIGVLPEPDDLWTRGKGAFKALLYMAAGLPVVASNVGVNSEVIVDGVTGYCVSDARGWVEAIERLAGDPALRAELGRRGRERVELRYSARVQAPRFAAVLRAAASAHGTRRRNGD